MSGMLVVGGGQAGAQAAMSLRTLGYDGDVTIAGAEDRIPYQRPPLSKAFLGGTATADSLHLRNPHYYDKAGIDVRCSARVTDVELEVDSDEAGGVAYLEDGSLIEFDRLMLAVGGRPRRLAVPGAELDGIHYLRTVEDATRLLAGLAGARRVVVVGGGFIGLEAASMARGRGLDVTVVEVGDRLLARAVDPAMSQFLLAAHIRRGSKFRLGRGVVGFDGADGTVDAVLLDDGDRLSADVVVVGVGLEPRLELAHLLGLQTQGAIVVDASARTSDPRVVAAGDCTLMPHPLTGEGMVRLESVQNAVDQAKVAAATMLDIPAVHNTVPWFWSHQGDLAIQMAGLTQGYDDVVRGGDLATEQFSLSYYASGTLIAVHAVNRPQDYLAGRRDLASTAANRLTGVTSPA